MLTIPEIAAAEVDKSLLEDDNGCARSIFFTGNKSAGKTTAIHNFLDKREAVRETLVLEYSFGRKTNQKQSAEKLICHLWEYGGKLELLTEVMSCVPTQGAVTVVIMLDLSKPKRVWPALETCLKAVEETTSRNSSTPVTLMIVGGKYDLFKNFESDVKRNICITIRSIALIYDANVIFYAVDDPALAKKLKQTLYFFGFSSGSFPKEKFVNHNKPLCIVRGSDSWESIGVSESNLESVKTRHLAIFPTELEDIIPSSGVAVTSSHSEPLLDALKKKKYDEMIDVLDLATIDYLKMLQ